MRGEQQSFTDLEYGNRRRVSRRETFLESMDEVIPWELWVGLIKPFYYADKRDGKKGRKPKALETMLRMYLLQVWFSCPMKVSKTRSTTLCDAQVHEAWTSRHSRSRTRPLCCISGI